MRHLLEFQQAPLERLPGTTRPLDKAVRWNVIEERYGYWCCLLSIPKGMFRLLHWKEFNHLNNPRLTKHDWGRCNRDTKTLTLAAYKMSVKNIDITLIHELLHLLYPYAGEKWIDKRAEVLAGYKRETAIKTTQRRVIKLDKNLKAW